jgi:hypothetical protein
MVPCSPRLYSPMAASLVGRKAPSRTWVRGLPASYNSCSQSMADILAAESGCSCPQRSHRHRIGGPVGRIDKERPRRGDERGGSEAQKAAARTLREIAEALNARGIATARGGQWYVQTVANTLGRA